MKLSVLAELGLLKFPVVESLLIGQECDLPKRQQSIEAYEVSLEKWGGHE